MDSPYSAEPNGARWLLVCTGPCCNSKGEALTLLGNLSRLLKAGLVDQPGLRKRYCLGYCTGKPVVCVMPERVHYSPQTDGQLQRILHEHLFGGQIVEDLRLPESPSR